MLYRLCKSMLQKGLVDGLQDKLDVFYAMGRLTQAEYQELCGMLVQG